MLKGETGDLGQALYHAWCHPCM